MAAQGLAGRAAWRPRVPAKNRSPTLQEIRRAVSKGEAPPQRHGASFETPNSWSAHPSRRRLRLLLRMRTRLIKQALTHASFFSCSCRETDRGRSGLGEHRARLCPFPVLPVSDFANHSLTLEEYVMRKKACAAFLIVLFLATEAATEEWPPLPK